MGEPEAQRAGPRRPGPFPVFAAALVAFALTAGLLSYQMRTGRDPVLGAQRAPLERVLVRRVVRQRVLYVDGGALRALVARKREGSRVTRGGAVVLAPGAPVRTSTTTSMIAAPVTRSS